MRTADKRMLQRRILIESQASSFMQNPCLRSKRQWCLRGRFLSSAMTGLQGHTVWSIQTRVSVTVTATMLCDKTSQILVICHHCYAGICRSAGRWLASLGLCWCNWICPHIYSTFTQSRDQAKEEAAICGESRSPDTTGKAEILEAP